MDSETENFSGFEADPADEAVFEEDFDEITTIAIPATVPPDVTPAEEKPRRDKSPRLEKRHPGRDIHRGLPLPERDVPNTTPDSLVAAVFNDEQVNTVDEKTGEITTSLITANQKWDNRITAIEKALPLIYCAFGLQPRHVPPCWKEHPPLVMCLSAIVHLWNDTYIKPGKPGTSENTFLQQLRLLRSELETLNTGRTCVTGEHQAWPIPDWITQAIPDNMNHFLTPRSELACGKKGNDRQNVVE